MADLPHGNAEGPAHDQNRHRGRQFATGKPVGDHLGEIERAQHEADTAKQSPKGKHDEPVGDCGERTAQRQAGQAERHQHAVRSIAAGEAGRDREHESWHQEQADQRADLGEAEMQARGQRIGHRPHGLELETEPDARCENEGEHCPALARLGRIHGVSYAARPTW